MTNWRKSTFSDGQGQCVELADLGEEVWGMRDSKLGDSSPVLSLSREALATFVLGAKAGEFDDLV